MDHISFSVDEIVTTKDSAFQYTYVHLKKTARGADLCKAIQTLEGQGVKGSEIFGYHTVDSNTPSEWEHIEDHPGFKTLVDHEARKMSEFIRWTANGYNPTANRGYNLLKNRLLAKSTDQHGFSGEAGGAGGSETESEEEHIPRPGSEEGGGNKRKRAASPGAGENMVSFREVMATFWDGSRSSVQAELQRQKHADTQLQELRAEMRHKDAQHAADLVKKEHDAQMKSKDDAHAAEMAGLRGELYAEYEERRLKALEEATAARKKLEEGFHEEKFKLEKNLQDMSQSKVVYLFLSAWICCDVFCLTGG
jgi:hypothetical protein